MAKKNNLGFVPIDRKEEGVALSMDVKTNIIAANIENIGKGIRIIPVSLSRAGLEAWQG